MDTAVTIIGAGIVGLAIAAELSRHTEEVYLIERHGSFGQETSSRNSEIIHSGVYYPVGSLKARLCVEGKQMLYDYCDVHDIAYRKCGKIIISQSGSDQSAIDNIYRNSKRNGITDHLILDRSAIHSLEPHVTAYSGIYFPSTGIIDSFGLMKALETEALNRGVQIIYGSEVVQINRLQAGYEIRLKEQQDAMYDYTSNVVINWGGLMAEAIARMVGINRPEYTTHYWKGEYFSLQNGKHKLLSRLVYPVPERHHVGLGIHTTLDLAGRVKLGPNAIYLPDHKVDYSIDSLHCADFVNSVKGFLPFIDPEDLAPDQVGIRPKLQKPGDPVRDFIISEESWLGYPGFVNLLGIESPGLTACLSIARMVKELLKSHL